MIKKYKVIYYSTTDGDSPVKDMIESRSINNQIKITAIIDYLQEKGANLPRPYADYLKDGIYEL